MESKFTVEAGAMEGNLLHSPKEGGCYTMHTGIKDTDRYLIAELTSKNENSGMVSLAFWCGKEQPELTVKYGLFPNTKTHIAFDLENLDGNQLFLPPVGICLKAVVHGIRANRDEITKIGLIVEPYYSDTCIEVHRFELTATNDYQPEAPQKIVDELGQWKQRDWKNKTQSVQALSTYLNEQLEQAKQFKGFDYGSAPKLEGTGFFRVEKVDGRFVLVTPDGTPFFSSGITGIRTDGLGRIAGLEGYFDELPSDPEFLEQVSAHNFKEKTLCVSFVASNLKKVFGENWKELWLQYVSYKVQDWGFNTIAAWSDEALEETSGIPYTAFLKGFPSTKQTIYRDFPDVFSAEYEQNAAEYAKQLERYVGKRDLIGYFMGNEPNFAFLHDLNIARELLCNPAALESKQRLIEHYQNKYEGDIAKLNAVWQTSFSSFDDLNHLNSKAKFSEQANNDLDDFSRVLVKQYIKVPALALKKVDPDHLNLGIRFSWIACDALYEGSEYLDVFSINCYDQSCNEKVQRIFEHTNKPVIIGEYHFGALDRGLPANGVRGTKTQEQRTQALQYYLEQAMSHPACVGVHYFQLYDQCILGRPDGENYQIGLLDICSREYEEVAQGYRQSHGKMMDILFGRQQPVSQKPEKMVPVFY